MGLLEEFDRDRDRVIEGVHAALGDHGATLEQIEGVVAALSDALWASQDADQRAQQGEKIERKARGQRRRLAALEGALDALISLSGVRQGGRGTGGEHEE